MFKMEAEDTKFDDFCNHDCAKLTESGSCGVEDDCIFVPNYSNVVGSEYKYSFSHYSSILDDIDTEGFDIYNT